MRFDKRGDHAPLALAWWPLVWAVLLALGPRPSAAQTSTSFSLNPRFEVVGADGDLFAQRTFLKTQGLVKNGNFGFSFEAFFERDFAPGNEFYDPALLRKSVSTAALQEAYVDYQLGPVFLRAGRQPVRWSQSWALPSLDIFTGRRWNRLFLDPVPEQLTHPDGILLTYAVADIEAEVFQVIQTAEQIFPEPLSNLDRKQEPQTGLRVKTRMHGLDLQLISRFRDADTLVGASASFAFDCCVIKLEAGQSADRQGFVVSGIDVFQSIWGGELTFAPQVTWFQDPILTNLEVETIGYVPLRYAIGSWSMELQYLGHLQKRESFASAVVSRDLGEIWRTAFKLTGYAQTYQGETGRLFGVYEALTGGNVYGARLDLNSSF